MHCARPWPYLLICRSRTRRSVVLNFQEQPRGDFRHRSLPRSAHFVVIFSSKIKSLTHGERSPGALISLRGKARVCCGARITGADLGSKGCDSRTLRGTPRCWWPWLPPPGGAGSPRHVGQGGAPAPGRSRRGCPGRVCHAGISRRGRHPSQARPPDGAACRTSPRPHPTPASPRVAVTPSGARARPPSCGENLSFFAAGRPRSLQALPHPRSVP